MRVKNNMKNKEKEEKMQIKTGKREDLSKI